MAQHLILAFSPTTLVASLSSLDRDPCPHLHVTVPFRSLALPSTYYAIQRADPHSLRPLLVALESALRQLTLHADLSAVETVSGTVPHPTSVSMTQPFPTHLEPHVTLDTQVPDLTIMDPFHTPSADTHDAGMGSMPPRDSPPFPGTVAHRLEHDSEATNLVPLGYILSSLLMQLPGAVTPQETAIFRGARNPVNGAIGTHARILPVRNVDPTEFVGKLGPYWRERWGLGAASVLPFLPSALAAHLAATPGPRDIVVIQGDIDHLIVPATCAKAKVQVGTAIVPNLFDGSHVALTHDPNGCAARQLVRDKYANGKWNVLGHLATLFAPGGSLGNDNKRFAFAHPYPVPGLTSCVSGTTRFEQGASVPEFHDLRANTRCILESQVLALREETNALGARSPERVILLSEDVNAAVPHLLSHVFDTAVYTADTTTHLATLGAAVVAAMATRPRVQGDDSIARLLTPSAHSRRGSIATPSLRLPLTPMGTGFPKHAHDLSVDVRPPSPALSDRESSWLKRVASAPEHKWEHELYDSMLTEFARVRAMVVGGLVTPTVMF